MHIETSTEQSEQRVEKRAPGRDAPFNRLDERGAPLLVRDRREAVTEASNLIEEVKVRYRARVNHVEALVVRARVAREIHDRCRDKVDRGHVHGVGCLLDQRNTIHCAQVLTKFVSCQANVYGYQNPPLPLPRRGVHLVGCLLDQQKHNPQQSERSLSLDIRIYTLSRINAQACESNANSKTFLLRKIEGGQRY